MGLISKLLEFIVFFEVIFIRKCKKLVKNLLVLDLTKRFGELKDGINDIKKHEFYEEVNWEELLDKKTKPLYIPEIRFCIFFIYKIYGIFKKVLLETLQNF